MASNSMSAIGVQTESTVAALIVRRLKCVNASINDNHIGITITAVMGTLAYGNNVLRLINILLAINCYY